MLSEREDAKVVKWHEFFVMARCWSENHDIGMDEFG